MLTLGIDRHIKVVLIRMYSRHSSASSRDFHQRMHILLEERSKNSFTFQISVTDVPFQYKFLTTSVSLICFL